MKYTLHKNGWTVFADVDLNTATKEELHELSNLCANYTCIKVREQFLTIDRELSIIKSFSEPYKLFNSTYKKFSQVSIDNEGYLGRVTADAIAGHREEMLWHNESPGERTGSDIAWLYAEKGVKGSTTVWNNSIVAYNDLDASIKEKIKDLRCINFGNVNHSITRTQENFDNRKIYQTLLPLIYTNHVGVTGLHLSLHQFERFDGMTREQSLEIAEPLFKFITQDKYCYYHEWQDGDVSMSDQWLGVHKRLHFENMDTRLVHRATFDYPAKP